MKLAEIGRSQIDALLAGDGLNLRAGRFCVNIRSSIAVLADEIVNLYGNTEYPESGFIDFSIELQQASGLHRYYHPQVIFSFNGHQPFSPLPLDQCVPLMEWGLNWCVSNHFHQYLVIHAAVVEKGGKALVLPGQPGSGKSTLCSALVTRGGYRLLSDELTLIDPENGSVWPNPRPISLKNKAIDLVKDFFPQGNYSSVVKDTVKGSVCLLAAPDESVDSVARVRQASPGLVVFPKYDADIKGYELADMGKGHAFIELANQSFNYPVLAEEGFKTIGKHLDKAESYNFKYGGDMDEAISVMDELILS